MGSMHGITLLPGEKIKLIIRRTPVGIILIWIGAAALIALLTFAWMFASRNTSPTPPDDLFSGVAPFSFPDFSFIIWVINLFLVGAGVVASIVYYSNELTITDQRAIHRQKISLFGESINAIELNQIEDISLHRNGIWQYIFHFGTIRMSTYSDETTYTFTFVDTPQDEIDQITQLVQRRKQFHRDRNKNKNRGSNSNPEKADKNDEKDKNNDKPAEPTSEQEPHSGKLWPEGHND